MYLTEKHNFNRLTVYGA